MVYWFMFSWVMSGYFGWRWLYGPDQRWQIGNLFMGYVLAGFLGACVLLMPVTWALDWWLEEPATVAVPVIAKADPAVDALAADRVLLVSLLQKVARVQGGCDRAYELTQESVAEYRAALSLVAASDLVAEAISTMLVLDEGVAALQKCGEALAVLQAQSGQVVNAEAREYLVAGISRLVDVADSRGAMVAVGAKSVRDPAYVKTPKAVAVMDGVDGLQVKALTAVAAFSAAKSELGLSAELPEFQ